MFSVPFMQQGLVYFTFFYVYIFKFIKMINDSWEDTLFHKLWSEWKPGYNSLDLHVAVLSFVWNYKPPVFDFQGRMSLPGPFLTYWLPIKWQFISSICNKIYMYIENMWLIARSYTVCSRYTYPGKCSRNKFSVHEHSDCEHCEMFSVPLRSDFKSAHISVCAVWLTCIVHVLRNM